MALFQMRRGTAASAATNNPVGSAGEPTYETDTGVFKILDGATAYNSLAPAATPLYLAGFTPPPGGWTALGSSTITTSFKSRLSTEASSTDNWRGEYRTLVASSNYTVTMYFDWGVPTVDYAQAGMFVRATTGALIHFGQDYQDGSYLMVNRWSSPTALASTAKSTISYALVCGFPNWLRIRDDNTNRYYEYSYNGVDWINFFNALRTDFITPTQIGWGQNPQNTGGSYTSRCRLRSYTES
jgi:hypothetical protein